VLYLLPHIDDNKFPYTLNLSPSDTDMISIFYQGIFIPGEKPITVYGSKKQVALKYVLALDKYVPSPHLKSAVVYATIYPYRDVMAAVDLYFYSYIGSGGKSLTGGEEHTIKVSYSSSGTGTGVLLENGLWVIGYTNSFSYVGVHLSAPEGEEFDEGEKIADIWIKVYVVGDWE